jgi:hypothetical protein
LHTDPFPVWYVTWLEPVQPVAVLVLPVEDELVPSFPAAAVTLLLLIVTVAGLPALAPTTRTP